MAYHTVTCLTVVCDLCDFVLGDADDGPQHYATAADALKYALVQGWAQLADGRLVCDDDHHAAVLAADAVARFEAAATETR